MVRGRGPCVDICVHVHCLGYINIVQCRGGARILRGRGRYTDIALWNI